MTVPAPVQDSGPGGQTGRDYDVVVLGGGPVGINAADRAHAEGLSVAIVERELVGGECNYWGCVPSKALLRPVLALADTRQVEGAREAVTGSINPAGVFGRRDRYVTNWDDSPVGRGGRRHGSRPLPRTCTTRRAASHRDSPPPTKSW